MLFESELRALEKAVAELRVAVERYEATAPKAPPAKPEPPPLRLRPEPYIAWYSRGWGDYRLLLLSQPAGEFDEEVILW